MFSDFSLNRTFLQLIPVEAEVFMYELNISAGEMLVKEIKSPYEFDKTVSVLSFVANLIVSFTV